MTPTTLAHSDDTLERRRQLIQMLGWLILAALAATPLVIDSAAWDDSFMTPKWAWLAGWGGAAAALLAARALAGRHLLIPLRPLFPLIFLWVAWHWIAAIWAPSGGLAIDRAARVTWLAVALWLAIHWLRTPRHLLLAALAWVITGVLTAFWVLADDVRQAWFPELLRTIANLPDWRGYLSAGLGNTNHIGDLLALTLLITLALYGEARRTRDVWLLGAAAVTITAGLIVSYSVGSNLGLIVGALLMIGLVWRYLGLRWFTARPRRWVAMFALWAGLVLFFNLDIAVNPHRPGILQQGFGSERWREGAPTRVVIWAQTAAMIRQHPWLGVGTGNFTYIYPEMDAERVRTDPELAPYRGKWTNAAHNDLMQAWAEHGLPGLLLLIGVIVASFRTALRRLSESEDEGILTRVTLAGLLAALLAQAHMNFVLQHPAGLLGFFAILAAIVAERDMRTRQTGMPPLINQTGPFDVTVVWETMRRPTGLGLGIRCNPAVMHAAHVALLAGALAWAAWCTRPVIAQREYRRAMNALMFGDGEAAIEHFETGLRLHPGAVDLRSRYSDVLIHQFGEPELGLEQLAIVRRRLNGNELWLREAHALAMLGREDEAERALERYERLSATDE